MCQSVYSTGGKKKGYVEGLHGATYDREKVRELEMEKGRWEKVVGRLKRRWRAGGSERALLARRVGYNSMRRERL